VQRGHTLEAVAHGYHARLFGACSRSNDIDDPKDVDDPEDDRGGPEDCAPACPPNRRRASHPSLGSREPHPNDSHVSAPN
jgi:hypothetical protein